MAKRIYLDSCLVIYLVEESLDFAPALEAVITNSVVPLTIVVSDLTRMESLILPLREKDQLLIDKFEGWFQQIDVVSLNENVFDRAAKLRADFPSLKTPDALHLSTAIYHNCSEFWTNDRRLHKVAPTLVKNILNN